MNQYAVDVHIVETYLVWAEDEVGAEREAVERVRADGDTRNGFCVNDEITDVTVTLQETPDDDL
jgi:hypothetical protein